MSTNSTNTTNSTTSNVPNFDNKPNETIEQIVAREVAKAEARIKAKEAKSKTNSIQLGATVKDLEIKEGKQIVNRESGEVLIDPHTGELKTYPNKYYVTLLFKGGSLKQEVKANIYNQLEINNDYFCVGYLGEVTTFGKTEMLPIFTEFEHLGA